MKSWANYVYLASSWRNKKVHGLSATLDFLQIPHYNFQSPPNKTGFKWSEVGHAYASDPDPDLRVSFSEYLQMIHHPKAIEGFDSDFEALKKADAVILLLPCGKSAHLELGWAIGHGKRTAMLLEDQMQPELMYKMCDFMTPDINELIEWLAIEPL